MRFRDFESKLKNKPFFNLNDARKLEPGFHRRQLVDWHARGFIQPLVGGFYILTGQDIVEGLLYMAANQVYAPSYVSLESALAYHQVIPESVLGVISITSRKTRQIESPYGQFSYRSVKPEYMFGYQIVTNETEQKFLMASLEKAVLDYLYLNTKIFSFEDFKGLRWNKNIINHLASSDTFNYYLKIINKQALTNRVALLMRYLNA